MAVRGAKIFLERLAIVRIYFGSTVYLTHIKNALREVYTKLIHIV